MHNATIIAERSHRMNGIPKLSVGDTLEMKKEHPCGAKKITVLRIGSDIRVLCCGCGRDMVVPRVKLEKSIKKIIPPEDNNVN